VGLWDSIKAETQAPRSVVNDDVQIAIDPARGAPIRAQRTEGLKFRPIETLTYPEMAALAAAQSPPTINSNVDDLLADDGEVVMEFKTSNRAGVGRPRRFNNNAERQKAYRERKKAR
jgi:hypothetical protein